MTTSCGTNIGSPVGQPKGTKFGEAGLGAKEFFVQAGPFPL